VRRRIPVNRPPPPVHIETITADHKPYAAPAGANGFTLPPLGRDREIRRRLTVWSEADSGAQIELTIPGAIAYSKSTFGSGSEAMGGARN